MYVGISFRTRSRFLSFSSREQHREQHRDSVQPAPREDHQRGLPPRSLREVVAEAYSGERLVTEIDRFDRAPLESEQAQHRSTFGYELGLPEGRNWNRWQESSKLPLSSIPLPLTTTTPRRWRYSLAGSDDTADVTLVKSQQ